MGLDKAEGISKIFEELFRCLYTNVNWFYQWSRIINLRLWRVLLYVKFLIFDEEIMLHDRVCNIYKYDSINLYSQCNYKIILNDVILIYTDNLNVAFFLWMDCIHWNLSSTKFDCYLTSNYFFVVKNLFLSQRRVWFEIVKWSIDSMEEW